MHCCRQFTRGLNATCTCVGSHPDSSLVTSHVPVLYSVFAVYTRVSRDRTVSIRCWSRSCCWISSSGSCSSRRVIIEGSTVLIWLLSRPQRRRLTLAWRDFQGTESADNCWNHRMMFAGIHLGGLQRKSSSRLWLENDKCVGLGLFFICGQWSLCWYQCLSR